jgi:1-phosphatidylinositol-3-phosphate 5-kinase
MYSYTHRNENLIVLVRHLLPKYCLPGESEGKIWMWTRCLRCERESGVPRSSRRVIMSAEAHYLSFGKFLELSFSSHSTARRLPICGHSLNTDCLRFFLGKLKTSAAFHKLFRFHCIVLPFLFIYLGCVNFRLGSKVAMFQYSSVEIYNACKPQPTLEIHNLDMHEWYGHEIRNVCIVRSRRSWTSMLYTAG